MKKIESMLEQVEKHIGQARDAEDGDEYFNALLKAQKKWQSVRNAIDKLPENSEYEHRVGELSVEIFRLLIP